MEFSLKEIKTIIDEPNFDKDKALDQQITLLTMKKKHLEKIIAFARGIKQLGVKNMDFSVFDSKKIDEYAKEAKKQWGETNEYKEFQDKSKNWSKQDEQKIMVDFMSIFTEFGRMLALDPAEKEVQEQVKKLKDYISKHFYSCSKEILASLGEAYGAGGEFTKNIDHAGGAGTAVFAAKAIQVYCGK